jgi:putative oxidoreductase
LRERRLLTPDKPLISLNCSSEANEQSVAVPVWTAGRRHYWHVHTATSRNRRLSMNLDTLSRYAPAALAVLRIVTALLFIEHGTQKLFDFPPSAHPMAGGLPPLLLLASIIETLGGILVLIGLFTRCAAFIMSGEMAIAFWTAHVPHAGSIFPIVNGGGEAVLYCFIFLYFVFTGADAFSVDAMLSRSRAATAARA